MMEGDHLDCSTTVFSRLQPTEMEEFLARESLQHVRSLTGLDCEDAPDFCERLLRVVAPHLESLEVERPMGRHLLVVGEMPALRRLAIERPTFGLFDDDVGDLLPPGAAGPLLPPGLVELRLCEATAAHMAAVAGLAALRKLDAVSFLGGKDDDDDDVPDLPPQLEELALVNAVRKQMLSLQRMPRLRRLSIAIASWEFGEPIHFPSLPAGHCGLSWLRVGAEARHESTLLSLVAAHAASLEELEVVCASRPTMGDQYYLAGLAAGLRGCDLRSLRRLTLRRRLLFSKGLLLHDAESCSIQLREVADALHRPPEDGDEAMSDVVVVECDKCSEQCDKSSEHS